MRGEWSFYGGGQFNGERMVMLRRWPVLKKGDWSLQRWSAQWRENGHATEVISLTEGECLC